MSVLSENERNAIEPDSARGDSVSASFVVHFLITIAERRKGIEAARCRLALLHLDIGTLLRRYLRRVLTRHKLTDLQFSMLVILFATEPESLPPSVLAKQAMVSRTAVKDALDHLESLQLIYRICDDFDRRIVCVRITSVGLDAIDAAINDYLNAAEEAARVFRPGSQRMLHAVCLQLLQGLTNPVEGLRDETNTS